MEYSTKRETFNGRGQQEKTRNNFRAPSVAKMAEIPRQMTGAEFRNMISGMNAETRQCQNPDASALMFQSGQVGAPTPKGRRSCQNCKSEFAIEPEDFDFYRKLDVPLPTWCPECRQVRRYAWRNERILYRRPCDLCGKSAVTIYSPNKPYKVYCPPCWWSDKWTAQDYGREFDFSRSFFEQFHELQLQVPRISLLTKNSVNSEYTNHCNNNKNCFRGYSLFECENVLYSNNIWQNGRDSMECYHSDEGIELSYECVDCFGVYQCQYGMLLRNCTDCYYCLDCRGCSHCFLCWNLRNKQYCIRNRQYTKEEYAEKIQEFGLDSYARRAELYQQYRGEILPQALYRFANIERSVGVSGNMIFNSKNSHHVFDADRTEDSKYAIISPDVKDTMDAYHYGFATELVYECHALIHCYHVLFSHLCYDNSNLEYCDGCHNSQDLFGCVGVKQGQYCIFNKKYDERSYRELRDKIIAHMQQTGEYGEFFPVELSPFGYNETQG
ncbi:MAG: hypothetical protein HY978_04095 [Candidatus Liptonbacteria bacterium]|nr:hypothetical protein [Candidatus Liptonbacteria bacterium]